MTNKSIAIVATAVGLVAAAAVTAARAPGRPRVSQHSTGGACAMRQAPPAAAASALPFGELKAGFARAKVLPPGGEAFAAVDLTARGGALSGPRPPLRLALVIDRSGSMSGEGKLERAKEAAAGIISRLQSGDSAAVVQYDHEAQVLTSLIAVDDAGRQRLLSAVGRIGPGGGTNLNAGLELGRDQLTATTGGRGLNRLILLSDGLTNTGVVDQGAIASNARAAADRGVRITTVGLGVDYNEDLMEAIAESGRGQYYYVRDAAGLERVFAQELNAIQATVATAVELRLEPACAGVELLGVPGYSPRRDGAALVLPMADVTGGESRRVLVRLRFPTQAAGGADALRVRLNYQNAATRTPANATVALGVEVTEDAAASDASVNRDVMVAVLQVESAEAMKRASAEYEQGRAAEAQRILAERQTQLHQLGNRYALPKASLEEPIRQMQTQSVGISSFAPSSYGGKNLIKGTKSAARSWSKYKSATSTDAAKSGSW